MKIWIDLANSPHVLMFRPLIPLLRSAGHEVVLTMRDFAQTVPLAKRFGLEGEVVAGHGGRSRLMKAGNLAGRTAALARFAIRHRPQLAVSHNAYAQVLAAKALGITTVTMMDYEGQPANHLAFRLADRVIVPDSFPAADLERFGASSKKTIRYPGFKEQIYLSNFTPSQPIRDDLAKQGAFRGSMPRDARVLVTVRTPATMAAYHRFENPLFEELLQRLNAREDVTSVVLARTKEQADAIRREHPRLFLPLQALDGPDLVAASDLVISAGGTMNREAAVLGTPAYTIFAGAIPAVDQALIKLGRLRAIRSPADLDELKLERKAPGLALSSPELAQKIASAFVTGRFEVSAGTMSLGAAR